MLRDLAQPSHLLILAIVIVVLFGWKKLPDAARSVGRSMRIFKSEMGEMKNDGKESKPSPAATDTVPGAVPSQQAAPQYGAPQQAAQQPTPAATNGQHAPVDVSGTQPQAAQPARHDNPAL